MKRLALGLGFMFSLIAAAPRLIVEAKADPVREEFDFDCDAPPARLSKWKRAVNEESLYVQGSLRVDEACTDPTYGPQARIYFSDASGDRKMGVYVVRANGHGDLEYGTFVEDESQNEISSSRQRLAIGKVVRFELHWRSKNRVEVKIGDAAPGERTISFRPAELTLSCSTAWVSFENVKLQDSAQK